MNLSNSERILKLIDNLVRNPRLIIPYVRMSLLSRKLPVDLGVPWWSFLAIRRADELFGGRKIFEYGTGGSTLRYAKIATSIHCVEDDNRWATLVRERLSTDGISNCTIQVVEFDFDNPVNFEASEYLHALHEKDRYDVIIIDGQDKTFRERIACFRHAEPLIGKGGLIVVDDWWRYTELLDNNKAKRVEVFESVGPCRIGVTSTAFFFY